MTLKNQILVIFLCFTLSFVYIRGFLSGVKTYQLNNSAYKKRKKGETFLEWLSYSRYKEEIPKILRVFYFAVLFVHLSCIIICLFLYMIKLPMNIGGAIATALVTPHMLVIGLGAMFSWLGFFSKKTWAALVGAILYCVGALLFILYTLYCVPLIILGFIGYLKQKKKADI